MQYLVLSLIGVVMIILLLIIIGRLQKKEVKEQDIEAIIQRLKDSFSTLSLDALSKNTAEFLKLANETLAVQTKAGEKELEGKKKLIDQTLEAMKKEMENVQKLVGEFEKDREKKFGELSTQLKSAAEQTGKLQETTNQLRMALASPKTRGKWGERMAEDVLRLAGFVEGINYEKQKALESTATRPDYTFLLPQGLKLNMDVKFPLDNYASYLEAENDTEKEKYKSQFLRDVKGRIKEVTTRDYINPEEHTVDYVIAFIPNEQVYAFIQESDSTILDEALKNKVILCSPITLYAILAIIRQAVDNFNLEKTAAQILSLLGAFNKQYKLFAESLEKMGRRIDEAQKEFVHLTSTRRNQLERPLRQIEDIRKQRGIPITSPKPKAISKK
ncbi:MAG: DNA recombination protein RmuC [Candidatus Omnitrophica bacterium]|nr:DNA recombination protein RmuC [Candidatus Omnitrophota bacterium]